MAHPAPIGNDSIPELLRRLRDDTSLLVRQEIALAKTEITEKATRVGRNVGYLVVGGLVAYAALIFFLLFISAVLTNVLVALGLEGSAVWLSPLIVAIVVGLISYSMIKKALETLSKEPLAPEKTVESLKEDKEWVKEKVT